MNHALIKVLISDLVRVATMPFRVLPIKKNRILFTGLTGGHSYDYSCNPKYIYEYMKEHYPGQFSYVWAVADKEKYAFLEEEGVKLVKHFTVSSFPMLLTSKFIITNGSYAPWFPFRKKQYVINTWHGGGAYKRVENDKPDANRATKKRAEFCAKNIDLFLASCRVQEENMIEKTFLYHKDILRAGTPRNDKLVRGDIMELSDKVKDFYQIPKDGNVILYAPTYRNTTIPVELDADRLLEGLEHADTTKKWYFLCRYHRYQSDDMQIHVTGNRVIDAANYPDMQELLCAADMLITDYSSCVWDYSFLYRPCFLFVPDKEEYIEKTGFYVELDKWPFLQAQNMKELLACIENYDERKGKKEIDRHLKELGSYESGNSCKQIAEIIQRERGK